MMNKDQNNKLLPKRRFPEFNNYDGWEDIPLIRKFNFQDGYPFSSNDFVDESNNSIQVIRITDINNRNKNNDKVFVPRSLIYDLNLDKYLVRKGDLLLSLTGAAGFNFFVWDSDSALLNQRTIKIIPKSKSDFASIYMLEPLIYEKINSLGTGQNNNLSKETLIDIRTSMPIPGEQQKIADCLSSLDDLISAESQKLELLKEHKTGLMQQLFPAEGEKEPKLRFPEFRGSGEWETESFRDIYSFVSTNSFSRDKLNDKEGIVKNIHYGDIHTKFHTLFDITKESVPYVDPNTPLDKIKDNCLCKEGDLILADASEDLADVGKSIEITFLNNEKLLSGLHTILARQIKGSFEIGFGGYLFKSEKIRFQIKKESQGAKVLGISPTRLAKIQITYPLDRDEQRAIVHCLSSLDSLIMVQNRKIEELKDHKKGLMQNLFPNPDEDLL